MQKIECFYSKLEFLVTLFYETVFRNEFPKEIFL